MLFLQTKCHHIQMILFFSLFFYVKSLSKFELSQSRSLAKNENSKNSILKRLDYVRDLRGGKVISGKKKDSALKSAMKLFENVKPATRLYLFISILCTVTEILGLPAAALFALEKSKPWELWRILTSKAYLGFSMSMANNLYFLIRYGQALENTNGTGYHLWFFLVQTVILTLLGYALGFPFQAKSLIAATVYSSCHLNPMELMQFQFEIVITAWQLPFCLMAVDCLSSQSVEAAWPHLLGIFSGHIFHFFTKVWPSLGGKAWLEPPKWFLKKFGDRPNSNVSGFSNRKSDDSSTKKRKIGKGRVLGSS